MVSDQSHLLDTWPLVAWRASTHLLTLIHLMIFHTFWYNASSVVKNIKYFSYKACCVMF
jgi:hypothetical protein